MISLNLVIASGLLYFIRQLKHCVKAAKNKNENVYAMEVAKMSTLFGILINDDIKNVKKVNIKLRVNKKNLINLEV